MGLTDDLERIEAVARTFAEPAEELVGILAAEPDPSARVYLCAYAAGETRTWLALDSGGVPVEDRALVRSTVSIAAMCELAEETAGGGNLEELRGQLVTLRLTENPPGIDEAEEAALALERAIRMAPRVATPEYLDSLGTATRQLEHALGTDGASPFAEAMKVALASVEALTAEVEASYKRPLA